MAVRVKVAKASETALNTLIVVPVDDFIAYFGNLEPAGTLSFVDQVNVLNFWRSGVLFVFSWSKLLIRLFKLLISSLIFEIHYSGEVIHV